MPDTAEADKRLVAWLKERTDPQLERIMEAPEDGLTDRDIWFVRRTGRKCLAGWAFDMSFDRMPHALEQAGIADSNDLGEAINIHRPYVSALNRHEALRRIKAYVAAELLTRRVNRKRLPAPQASVDGMGELYALEAEA